MSNVKSRRAQNKCPGMGFILYVKISKGEERTSPMFECVLCSAPNLEAKAMTEHIRTSNHLQQLIEVKWPLLKDKYKNFSPDQIPEIHQELLKLENEEGSFPMVVTNFENLECKRQELNEFVKTLKEKAIANILDISKGMKCEDIKIISSDNANDKNLLVEKSLPRLKRNEINIDQRSSKNGLDEKGRSMNMQNNKINLKSESSEVNSENKLDTKGESEISSEKVLVTSMKSSEKVPETKIVSEKSSKKVSNTKIVSKVNIEKVLDKKIVSEEHSGKVSDTEIKCSNITTKKVIDTKIKSLDVNSKKVLCKKTESSKVKSVKSLNTEIKKVLVTEVESPKINNEKISKTKGKVNNMDEQKKTLINGKPQCENLKIVEKNTSNADLKNIDTLKKDSELISCAKKSRSTQLDELVKKESCSSDIPECDKISVFQQESESATLLMPLLCSLSKYRKPYNLVIISNEEFKPAIPKFPLFSHQNKDLDGILEVIKKSGGEDMKGTLFAVDIGIHQCLKLSDEQHLNTLCMIDEIILKYDNWAHLAYHLINFAQNLHFTLLINSSIDDMVFLPILPVEVEVLNKNLTKKHIKSCKRAHKLNDSHGKSGANLILKRAILFYNEWAKNHSRKLGYSDWSMVYEGTLVPFSRYDAFDLTNFHIVYTRKNVTSIQENVINLYNDECSTLRGLYNRRIAQSIYLEYIPKVRCLEVKKFAKMFVFCDNATIPQLKQFVTARIQLESDPIFNADKSINLDTLDLHKESANAQNIWVYAVSISNFFDEVLVNTKHLPECNELECNNPVNLVSVKKGININKSICNIASKVKGVVKVARDKLGKDTVVVLLPPLPTMIIVYDKFDHKYIHKIANDHPNAIFCDSVNALNISKLYTQYALYLTNWIHTLLEYQGLVPDFLFNSYGNDETFILKPFHKNDIKLTTFYWDQMLNGFINEAFNGFSCKYESKSHKKNIDNCLTPGPSQTVNQTSKNQDMTSDNSITCKELVVPNKEEKLSHKTKAVKAVDDKANRPSVLDRLGPKDPGKLNKPSNTITFDLPSDQNNPPQKNKDYGSLSENNQSFPSNFDNDQPGIYKSPNTNIQQPSMYDSQQDNYGHPQDGFGPPQGGFGPSQGGFGPPQGGFGPPQDGFGSPQGGFGPPQGEFGPAQGGYGPAQGGYGPPQGGFGPPQGGYGPPQGGYGPPQGGYGPPQGGFGPPQGGYGPPQGGFGPPPNEFGPPSNQFGPPPNKFGPPPGGFGPPPGGFGPPPDGFGPPPSGFGPPPRGFGPPSGGFGPPPNEFGPPPSRFSLPSLNCPPPVAYGAQPAVYESKPNTYGMQPELYNAQGSYSSSQSGSAASITSNIIRTEGVKSYVPFSLDTKVKKIDSHSTDVKAVFSAEPTVKSKKEKTDKTYSKYKVLISDVPPKLNVQDLKFLLKISGAFSSLDSPKNVATNFVIVSFKKVEEAQCTQRLFDGLAILDGTLTTKGMTFSPLSNLTPEEKVSDEQKKSKIKNLMIKLKLSPPAIKFSLPAYVASKKKVAETLITVSDSSQPKPAEKLIIQSSVNESYKIRITNISLLVTNDLISNILKKCQAKVEVENEWIIGTFNSKQRASIVIKHLNNWRIIDKTIKVLCSEHIAEENINDHFNMGKVIDEEYSVVKSAIVEKLQSYFEKTKDIYLFKTKRCPDDLCPDFKDCYFYHTTQDKRRNLRLTYYRETLCKIDCQNKQLCPKSHNMYEVEYHSSNYLKLICPDWISRQCCENRYCPNCHPKSSDMFYHQAWKDLFVIGLGESLFFLNGAIQNLFKDSNLSGLRVVMVSPSTEFVQILNQCVMQTAQNHGIVLLKIITGDENLSGVDVVIGTPFSLKKMAIKTPLNSVKTLIVDEISTILSNPYVLQDFNGFMGILYKHFNRSPGEEDSTWKKDKINKVVVSEVFNEQEISNCNSLFRTTFEHVQERLDWNTILESIKTKKNLPAKRSRSPEPFRRRKRSRSPDQSKYASRTRSKSPLSKRFSRRSRSKSPLSKNSYRNARYEPDYFRRAKGGSKDRSSSYNSPQHENSPKQKNDDSPVIPTPMLKTSHHVKEEKVYPSSSNASKSSSVNETSTSSLQNKEEFILDMKKLKFALDEEYSLYLEVPEIHKDFEEKYGLFHQQYHAEYKDTSNVTHIEECWKKWWSNFLNALKKETWSAKQKEIIKKHSSSVESQATSKLDVELTLNLIKELSSEVQGVQIETMINLIKNSGLNTRKGKDMLLSTDSGMIFKMFKNSLLKEMYNVDFLKRKKFLKCIDCISNLLEFSDRSTPKRLLHGVDIEYFASITRGKNSCYIVKMIMDLNEKDGLNLKKDQMEDIISAIT